MRHFRLRECCKCRTIEFYFIGQDGRFIKSIDLSCANDGVAIE